MMAVEKRLHVAQIPHGQKHREELAAENHLVRTCAVGIRWTVFLRMTIDNRMYWIRLRER